MRKYFHALNIGFQNNLTYRFNFLARTLFGFIPLMAMLMLWRKIYSAKGEDATVSSFTLVEMTTYYLIVTIVEAFTAVNEDDWQIAADIKDGNISQFLLKPINYLWFRFCLYLSGRVTYLTVAFVPIALLILFLRDHFVFPASPTTVCFFAISLALTAMLQFFMSFAMAMLAFWVLEVSTFIFILYALEYLASGHMFPLEILPPMLKEALLFTPFPYQLYLPVGIYMGKITGSELLRGLIVQAGWVVAMYWIARMAWGRGVRKYSAVGG